MALSDEARERLADIVELQPTKNSELQDRWGMDSGSDVHQYLENELKEYYYRNEDSLICATPEAVEVMDQLTDHFDELITRETPDEQYQLINRGDPHLQR